MNEYRCLAFAEILLITAIVQVTMGMFIHGVLQMQIGLEIMIWALIPLFICMLFLALGIFWPSNFGASISKFVLHLKAVWNVATGKQERY